MPTPTSQSPRKFARRFRQRLEDAADLISAGQENAGVSMHEEALWDLGDAFRWRRADESACLELVQALMEELAPTYPAADITHFLRSAEIGEDILARLEAGRQHQEISLDTQASARPARRGRL